MDKNPIRSDGVVGTVSLGSRKQEAGSSATFPSVDALAQGETWSTDGEEAFSLQSDSGHEVGTVRLSMRIAPRRWSWQHKLTLRSASAAVLGLGRTKSLAAAAQGATEASTPLAAEEKERLEEDIGAKVHLRVLSASNLPQTDGSFFELSPFVTLSFRDEREARTSLAVGSGDSRNPSWLESEEEQHLFRVPRGAWKSRVRGEVWHRAAVPPDVRLATFELCVSEVQLEVSVIDLKLTQDMADTLPQTEVPTIRLMCVRTEPTGGLSATTAEGDGAADAMDEEAASRSAAAAQFAEGLVVGLRNAVDEMASLSAARAVADLCYDTSADGPAKRKAFTKADGAVALVAMLHAFPPASPVVKWVAEALRALAKEQSEVAHTAVEKGAIPLLEAVVESAQGRRSAQKVRYSADTAVGHGGHGWCCLQAALEAEKALAVLRAAQPPRGPLASALLDAAASASARNPTRAWAPSHPHDGTVRCCCRRYGGRAPAANSISVVSVTVDRPRDPQGARLSERALATCHHRSRR